MEKNVIFHKITHFTRWPKHVVSVNEHVEAFQKKKQDVDRW